MLDSAEPRTFGALLRQHRLAAGLTQAALAERADLAERTLQDLERGAARPRQATLRRLVVVLGLLPAAQAELQALSSAPRRTTRATRAPDSDTPGHQATILPARPTNLPIQPTKLLGRDRELAETSLLLRDGARLVTLTGPGGVGKTRLGIAVAAALLDAPSTGSGQAFADGVFLVELAPLADPVLVASSIAQVLDVRHLGQRTPIDGLRDHLRRRHVLLLLDNFEHIVAAAPFVADLLAWCPGLTVLATSREPLRLRGEREYAVLPLALPDAGHPLSVKVLSRYPAVALFVERAAAIRADFALTEENAAAVAEICARLDGLPLAIELAAGRIRILTTDDIAQRLDRRLPLLTGGTCDLPARQQTLRATIAWSHDLLDEQERRLFRRLAVFVGGWPLEAAEAVCNPGDLTMDMLDGLESLTARSLIQRVEAPDHALRFSMLETIREYGLEQLDASGEASEIRRAHAAYVLDLATRAEPELFGREQGAWLQRLDADLDNIRSVFGRSLTGEIDVNVGLLIVGTLHWYWGMRVFIAEARGWTEAMLARPEATTRTIGRAWALYSVSALALFQADYVASEAFAGESAAIFREAGDLRGAARALARLGSIPTVQHDHRLAISTLEESVALARAVDDQWGLAFALGQLAAALRNYGDFGSARGLYEESVAISQEIGDQYALSITLGGLAYIAREEGNRAESAELWQRAIVASSHFGDHWLLPRAVAGVAGATVLAGEPERAAMLFGFAEALRESTGTRDSPFWQGIVDQDVATAREALGGESFTVAWAEGRTMSLKQALTCALEATGPA